MPWVDTIGKGPVCGTDNFSKRWTFVNASGYSEHPLVVGQIIPGTYRFTATTHSHGTPPAALGYMWVDVIWEYTYNIGGAPFVHIGNQNNVFSYPCPDAPDPLPDPWNPCSTEFEVASWSPIVTPTNSCACEYVDIDMPNEYCSLLSVTLRAVIQSGISLLNVDFSVTGELIPP